jgi:hypothetical protein
MKMATHLEENKHLTLFALNLSNFYTFPNLTNSSAVFETGFDTKIKSVISSVIL